jgi:glycosyltransferase involved in cell wall biosynthesis
MTALNVLFIEPYFGGSHRAFAEGYRNNSRHHIDLLTMPARKWKWRMRGGALYLADRLPERFPDVLLVSDFLDLATFTALRPDPVARIPSVAYFHENQLTYPVRNEDERDFQFGLTNITTCLAADRVAFNSSYHRESFLTATEELFGKMPDFVPEGTTRRIRARSDVVPVGVDLSPIDALRRKMTPREGPLRILWNHRWEFDKNPGAFFRVIERLDHVGLDFELAVAGQSFRHVPDVFEWAEQRFADRIEVFGTIQSRQRYLEVLLESDVVVSTAIHEFFGISVVEAVYAGCTPLLPDRLSYPELLPDRSHAQCLYGDEDEMFRQLRRWIEAPSAVRRMDLREAMERFKWNRVAPQLDATLVKACEAM